MFKPIVIIGAPRSGTNMLRDMLVELNGVGTWPCDEINYIWRHGNIRYPSDEFIPEMASPTVQQYIRSKFDRLANKGNLDVVIEKTCANSLRVGFVDKILPNAKYIFIMRDGMDTVGSALKRWHASFEPSYIMRKAIFVPPMDLPYYASRYIYNHIYRMVSGEKRLAFWGPEVDNAGDLLEKYTLAEVSAIQWKACVENAERDFASISPDRIYRIMYEDFVQNPVAEFAQLAKFIEKSVPDNLNTILNENVKSSSVGKGRRNLSSVEFSNLRQLIGETLDRYGYE